MILLWIALICFSLALISAIYTMPKLDPLAGILALQSPLRQALSSSIYRVGLYRHVRMGDCTVVCMCFQGQSQSIYSIYIRNPLPLKRIMMTVSVKNALLYGLSELEQQRSYRSFQ